MGESYQWKANGQCSRRDSGSFATEVIVVNEQSRPLLLRRRRHKLTEESLREASAPGENVSLEGKVRKACKDYLRVNSGILPYVKITNLNRHVNSATNVCTDTLRLMASQ